MRTSTSHDRKGSDSNARQRHLLNYTALSLGIFALLEQRSFITAAPSSVICLGIFAVPSGPLGFLLPKPLKGYVPATGPVATEQQRTIIQKLGKKFGCHQCGSRHFFTSLSFIADHQPPTKFALEAGQRGWRKMFNFQVL
jgi:hypothetical protein